MVGDWVTEVFLVSMPVVLAAPIHQIPAALTTQTILAQVLTLYFGDRQLRFPGFRLLGMGI